MTAQKSDGDVRECRNTPVADIEEEYDNAWGSISPAIVPAWVVFGNTKGDVYLRKVHAWVDVKWWSKSEPLEVLHDVKPLLLSDCEVGLEIADMDRGGFICIVEDPNAIDDQMREQARDPKNMKTAGYVTKPKEIR